LFHERSRSRIRLALRRSAETPVHFGGTIACRLTVTEIDDRHGARAEVVFQNQEEEVVIEADLTGSLPGVPERRVMEAMRAEGDPTDKCRYNPNREASALPSLRKTREKKNPSTFGSTR
jgi:hypothetical protein